MIELELTLETEAPLVLRASRTRTQFTPTLTHIPGVSLRGALALEYLRTQGSPEDQDFQTLFLSETVSFGPLFPSSDEALSHPLPASAVICKRYGKDHPNSAGDALLRLELADQLDSLAPLENWENCPDCQLIYPDRKPNKRDRLSGYFHIEGGKFTSLGVKTRMLTGVGMSRLTHTSAHGLLFSMEAIEEAQRFKGRIRIYGENTESLSIMLQKLVPQNGFLRVGGARSRGKGRMRVVDWQEVQDITPSLNERWLQLNQIVQNLWQEHGADPNGEYFTLTLESPIILMDDLLRPVHPDILNPMLHFGLPEEVKMCRKMINGATLQGWNAAWHLPKEDTFAFGMGSVLLFRIPPSLRETVQARLGDIETYGLGERRNEGFGRTHACYSFHYWFESSINSSVSSSEEAVI